MGDCGEVVVDGEHRRWKLVRVRGTGRVNRYESGGKRTAGLVPAAISLLLSEKLRVLTAFQVAKTWFQHTRHPLRSAMSCLRDMAARDEVLLDSAMLHPEIELSTPLLDWIPGGDEPDFGRLAWRAKSRFTEPPKRTCLVLPGSRLGAVGKLRRLRATETQHDVMVTSILLNLARHDTSVIDRWSHEDVIRERFRPGEKRPDAILLEGSREVLIECAGSYSKAKLQAVHQAFAQTPYKLF